VTAAAKRAGRATIVDCMGDRRRAMLVPVAMRRSGNMVGRGAPDGSPLERGGGDSMLVAPHPRMTQMGAVREMVDASGAVNTVGVNRIPGGRQSRATEKTRGGDGDREAQHGAHRRTPANSFRTLHRPVYAVYTRAIHEFAESATKKVMAQRHFTRVEILSSGHRKFFGDDGARIRGRCRDGGTRARIARHDASSVGPAPPLDAVLRPPRSRGARARLHRALLAPPHR